MILLMEEILHQLRLVVYRVYPMIYKGFYIPGGCLGFLPSTVPTQTMQDLRANHSTLIDPTMTIRVLHIISS